MSNRPVEVFKIAPDSLLPIFATAGAACADVFVDLNESCLFNGDHIVAYSLANMVCNIPVDGQSTETTDDRHLYIPPGFRALIPTGLRFDLDGQFISVFPRSGLSTRFGLTLANSVGIIDEDYTDQLYIPILNVSGCSVRVSHRERIAQIQVLKSPPQLPFVEIFDEPSQKGNRTGGFGSTGSK